MSEKKSLDALHKKHHMVDITLNRLRTHKAALNNQIKQSDPKKRKARTRTLIQIGGLVTLTDLPTLCGIREGDDLQYDMHALDNAATLLGMLLTAQDHLSTILSDATYASFKRRGLRQLKNKKIPLPSPLTGTDP